MSSVSSVNSSNDDLFALLQKVSRSRTPQGTGSTSSSGGGPDLSKIKDFEKKFEDAGLGDSSKFNSLQSQIQSAVQNVFQNLGSSGSGGDPKTQIQNAVDGVLKQNGIDTSKYNDIAKQEFGDGPTGLGGAGGSGSSSSLQGFDISKFQQDLQSLFSNSGNSGKSDGSFDFSKLFKSQKAGSGVDVYA